MSSCGGQGLEQFQDFVRLVGPCSPASGASSDSIWAATRASLDLAGLLARDWIPCRSGQGVIVTPDIKKKNCGRRKTSQSRIFATPTEDSVKHGGFNCFLMTTNNGRGILIFHPPLLQQMEITQRNAKGALNATDLSTQQNHRGRFVEARFCEGRVAVLASDPAGASSRDEAWRAATILGRL